MSLGTRLGVSAMAVRQHLYALQDQRLVVAKERPVPFGRPAKYWELTPEADRLFPDAYAELSVSLIDAINDAFGPEGLQQILKRRAERQRAQYLKQIPGACLCTRSLRSWPECERKRVHGRGPTVATGIASCSSRTTARFAPPRRIAKRYANTSSTFSNRFWAVKLS